VHLRVKDFYYENKCIQQSIYYRIISINNANTCAENAARHQSNKLMIRLIGLKT